MESRLIEHDYLFFDGTYNPLGLFYKRQKRLPNILGLNKIKAYELWSYLLQTYPSENGLIRVCNAQLDYEYSLENKIKDFYFELNDKLSVVYGTRNMQPYNDVKVLYADSETEREAKLLVKKIHDFKEEVIKHHEIHIITYESGSFSTRKFEVEKSKINLKLHYNDDFYVEHKRIIKKLNKTTKGILLLHGLPGTGKTSYIRYLLSGCISKNIIYVPNDIAPRIASPEFIPFLCDYKNSVLLIEDAEDVVEARNRGRNSAVANLLNLSDGLLSDMLNIQLICTFNTELRKIDSALLRKGRIIAQYEFKKLKKDKAQKLSDKAGFKTLITEDKTLAELYNQDEPEYYNLKMKEIGY